MSLREKFQKVKDITRGLKEDYQTIKKARDSGELDKEIRRGEQQEKISGLSFKEKMALAGLKAIRKKPIRKSRTRKTRRKHRREY